MPVGETESMLSHLSPTARHDLAHLAKNSAKLAEIADCASELKPGIGLSGAAPIIAGKSGLTVPEAHRILRTICNLYELKNRLRLDTLGLMRAISSILEDRAPDARKNENLQAWTGAASAVSEFVDRLNDEYPLVVARKAERLGIEHQNVFSEARIVTDVRPVFDSTGGKILESFVMQTLLIDYFDGSESRRSEFALDAADVAQLRRLCERAERKALALKAELDKLPWPSTILGEEGS